MTVQFTAFKEITHLLHNTGCPKTVRSDYGTENCFLAATHIAFRGNHSHVYRYGKSTTNTVNIIIIRFTCA